MPQRNTNFTQLKAAYLFPEINARKKQFLSQNPLVTLISLGIGDTTEPLSEYISTALALSSAELKTLEGYSGYGPEQGEIDLREKISHKIYKGRIKSDEIFISDGAKCDIGRLQILFGNQISIAVQDPAYPVYVEGSLIQGVKKIVYMPCHPENNFFPELKKISRTDLIYFCSPNNPTGAVATKQQLEELVSFAKENRSIIIYDSAYSNYIQNSDLPKSIFDIEGAREVAIETSSFSKLAGFTGVRLGWTVVPEELKFDDGESVKADWHRLISTLFNGASNIAQKGGKAVLDEKGWSDSKEMTQFYLENATILKKALENKGHQVFGGTHAPYLWVRFKGKKSWEIFQYFLEKLHLVTTPGSGFGPHGEEFVRFSSFGHRSHIIEASKRINLLDSLDDH